MELESVIKSLPVDQHQVLSALKILVDAGVFSALVRANKNRLVDGRMDSDDEAAVAREVREVRQTNRVLLGFEESAKQLTEGMSDA